MGAAYARIAHEANAAADAQLRAIATSKEFIADRRIAATGLVQVRRNQALADGPAIDLSGAGGGAGGRRRATAGKVYCAEGAGDAAE